MFLRVFYNVVILNVRITLRNLITCKDLLSAIEKAAIKNLPSTKPINSGWSDSKIMDWNEDVRPFKVVEIFLD